MKTLALSTIIALGFAAPTLAQTQLERLVGAESGQYTLNELVQIKAASDTTTNEKNVYLGNQKLRFSSSNVHNATAAKIFDELAAESRGDN